ncbi:MAG: PPOX class F420-dependent oxidoreductase [Anaerolineaceae bacterium]|nr:PPOX class F420-dependent oxidoreductase [Anaerolineaceae bacterium]
MSATIPDSHRELLAGPTVVTLVTMMPDGQPQATPVWCKLDGDDILVNSQPGRRKDSNIRANNKVTVMALDHQNPYSYIEVRGEVTHINEDDEALIDELARLYTGADSYFGDFAAGRERSRRVTYRITPRRVLTQ